VTVTNIQKDPAAKTMTVTADFDAPVARVWQMWDDPRQLEKWWGPPTYPATFVEHSMAPDGRMLYFMTSPEGEKHYGWWRIRSVSAPHKLEFEDGFADDNGKPNDAMPVTVSRVTLIEQGNGTRMVIESTFPSTEAMQQMLEMGMEQGLSEALGQIDALLAV
jgi:uncharacterized protein YndB with AHSA1/START domain